MTFKQLAEGLKSQWADAHINYCSTRAELKKFVERAERQEENGMIEYRTLNANDVIDEASTVIKFYYIMDGIKETVRTLSKVATKEEEKKWLENWFMKLDDIIWNEIDNKIETESIKRKYENIYYG